MSADKDEEPYEVGYGKPPKEHRFKKGVSGNEGGKKKGTKSLKTDWEEELKSLVEITEKGKKRKISKQLALIKGSIAQAIKGNQKATVTVLKLVADVLGFDPQTVETKGLPKEDQEIIDLYHSQNGYVASVDTESTASDDNEIDPLDFRRDT